MLARYKIPRGKVEMREFPLPEGIRQDVRHRCFPKHPLAPKPEMVEKYFANPTSEGRRRFRSEYEKLLEKNYSERRSEVDALAEKASASDVYVGCSCPTKANPDVNHCHTVIALQFMKKKYPKLEVQFP